MDDDALVRAAQQHGTPVYVYAQATITQRCAALRDAMVFPRCCLLYAMKANSNAAVVRTVLAAGFGLECVSHGEVLLALRLGAQRVLYTNNNVADDEFSAVVQIAQSDSRVWINCDSLQRLEDLPHGMPCFVRVNGPVGGGHHDHVITCGPNSKFGVPWEEVPAVLRIVAERRLKLIGVHQHIGSGILEADVFARAMDVMLRVLREHPALLRDLEYVNFGGGLGVPYRPTDVPLDVRALGAVLTERFQRFCVHAQKDLTLVLEPGRYPVAESGYLVARVNTLKPTPYGKTFVGVDTGFNHLVRPTTYGSYHHISNLNNPHGEPQPYYVAGYVCESGDVFTRSDDGNNTLGARLLPHVRRGDLLAIHTAGAYGYSMASEYNLRPRPAELLLLPSGDLRLVRKPRTLSDLLNDALHTAPGESTGS